MLSVKDHWDKVYNTKAPDQVSWDRPHLDILVRRSNEWPVTDPHPLLTLAAANPPLLMTSLRAAIRTSRYSLRYRELTHVCSAKPAQLESLAITLPSFQAEADPHGDLPRVLPIWRAPTKTAILVVSE